MGYNIMIIGSGNAIKCFYLSFWLLAGVHSEMVMHLFGLFS